MKTLIAILTAGAVLGFGVQRVSAHDGWSTTGKILTGLVIGGAVARAFEPPPTVVYAPAPVVYSAPVTYAPAQAVTYAPAAAPAVTYAPAPVYVQQPPVVVYTAPAYAPYGYYYGPRYWGPPLVSFRFGFGGGYHHRGHW